MHTSKKPANWRFRLAERIAGAYAEDANAEVVMIAGSVGRRWDDPYSDIEIDVYYDAPPTDRSRTEAVKRAGGTLVLLDEDRVEWEEQMTFNRLLSFYGILFIHPLSLRR